MSLPAGGRRAGDWVLCGAEGTWPLSELGQRLCQQAPAAGAVRAFLAFPYQHS